MLLNYAKITTCSHIVGGWNCSSSCLCNITFNILCDSLMDQEIMKTSGYSPKLATASNNRYHISVASNSSTSMAYTTNWIWAAINHDRIGSRILENNIPVVGVTLAWVIAFVAAFVAVGVLSVSTKLYSQFLATVLSQRIQVWKSYIFGNFSVQFIENNSVDVQVLLLNGRVGKYL